MTDERTLPLSYPSELVDRIAIAIRQQVAVGNVGLTASIAAQVATDYYNAPRTLPEELPR